MHTLVHQPAMLAIVVAYLAILLLVGLHFYNKQKSVAAKESGADFFLAGRSLGKIVAVGTMLATFTGNGTISGGGNSLAFNYGLWSGIFFVVPPILSFSFLYFAAPKIRAGGHTTVAEMIEDRFGSNARFFAGIIIALAMVSIVSYQYRGLGFILNATTGISVETCTAICCAVVVALAFSGGLRTVAATDALSAFLMVGGLVIGIPFLLNAIGGWSWVIENAAVNDPKSLTFFGGQTLIGWAGGYLPLFFLTIGDQNYYQRINAAKDLKTARAGLLGSMAGCCIIMPVVAIYAFCAKQWFGGNIRAGQALISTATLMPTIIGGGVLSAAAAFTITTGDSYLLSGASNFTIDIYRTRINPKATPADEMRASRWFILIAGVLAYVILQFFPSVLAIQYWSYTIYAAGMTPAVVGALLWSKCTKPGGVASMFVGTALTIAWEATLYQATGLQTIYVALPASFIVLVLVSLCTQPQKS